MTTVRHTRTSGRRLTYEISANDRGYFTVRLGAKEMMRGRDALAADGRHRSPNKRKAVGAIHQAKLAIERLTEMDEI